MKIKRYILPCLLFHFFACGPSDFIKFETPQPVFEKTEPAFGRKIQGEYEKVSFSEEKLYIGEESIILNALFADSCSRNDLETDTSIHSNLKNDQELINYFKHEGYSTKIVNDSIFYSKTFVDTIFKINEAQVLKKFKGNYYLNYRMNDGFWSLKIVYLQYDTLYFDEIIPSSDINNYNYIEKNEKESGDSTTVIEYVLNPDKKEFKKLLNSGMIQHSEKYVRKAKQN